MRIWREQVEAKAKLVHLQLAAARQLAQEFGGDIDAASEPYLALLSTLYEEEFPLANLLDNSDLVVRFEGPAVGHEPPAGLVSVALKQIREEVRNVAKAVIGLVKDDVRWPAGLDPHLAGIAQGSLIIGVRVPTEHDLLYHDQLSIEGVNDTVLDSVRSAVRSLQTVSRHISDNGVDDGIAEDIPDPAVRDAVLMAAQNLAPTGRKGIDRVSFLGGRLASPTGEVGATGIEGSSLTPRSRLALRQVIREPVMLERRKGRFTGVVREIDLDVNRFEIRHVPGVIGGIRCIYPESLYKRVRTYLDATVEVRGEYEAGPDKQPRLVRVEHVKIVSRPSKQLPLKS
jgi:hypothetical protein